MEAGAECKALGSRQGNVTVRLQPPAGGVGHSGENGLSFVRFGKGTGWGTAAARAGLWNGGDSVVLPCPEGKRQLWQELPGIRSGLG